MSELTLFNHFLVALALGALIGLEREYAKHKQRGHAYAGIRTFPLIALLGALSAYLGELISIWLLVMGFLVVGMISVLAYHAVSEKKHIGATTEIAGMLTFFLGVIAYRGDLLLAAALAIMITLILYTRSMLHRFAEKIKEKELGATLTFAVIALVILPFLPNQWYLKELFNPFLIWLMVVLISGISFAGYLLLKWFGRKGITLAGLFGGLVSSTATTVSLAVRSKKEKKVYPALALAVILANGMMFLRVLIEVSAVNQQLFREVFLPLLALMLATAVFSYFIWKKAREVREEIKLGSPLSLKPALKFALFFALILALVKVANVYLSTGGVYLVSFFSGFADVDAITLSLSELAKNGLDESIACRGIILAVLTNVAVKAGIVLWLGGEQFRKIVLMVFAFLVVMGAGMFFLM